MILTKVRGFFGFRCKRLASQWLGMVARADHHTQSSLHCLAAMDMGTRQTWRSELGVMPDRDLAGPGQLKKSGRSHVFEMISLPAGLIAARPVGTPGHTPRHSLQPAASTNPAWLAPAALPSQPAERLWQRCCLHCHEPRPASPPTVVSCREHWHVCATSSATCSTMSAS